MITDMNVRTLLDLEHRAGEVRRRIERDATNALRDAVDAEMTAAQGRKEGAMGCFSEGARDETLADDPKLAALRVHDAVHYLNTALADAHRHKLRVEMRLVRTRANDEPCPPAIVEVDIERVERM